MENAVSTKEQNDVVENAVQFINGKYEGNKLEISLEIGRYTFKNLYNSDEDAVASKDSNKKVSFNKLCKHPQLGIERSLLCRMVNTAIQEDKLKDSGIDLKKLTYSHRVELLKIDDKAEKIAMAKHCVEKQLSIRALRDEIKDSPTQHSSDKLVTITSQTMSRFETSEKAIKKIDELIADVDLKNLKTDTRNNLHKKATSFLAIMKETTTNLSVLIEEIDKISEKKA